MSIDLIAGSTATGTNLSANGGSATGTIDAGGDQDWYRVQLVAGHQYSFELFGLDSFPGTLTLDDPLLRLMNASGAQVAIDDDSGFGLESRITFTAAASGTFYLSAQGYVSDSGTFRITSTDLGNIPDVEGSTATNVTVFSEVTGTIGAAGDQDWYRVNLTAGHQYTFDLLGIDTGGQTLNDPLLRLLNASGTVLSTDDDSGVGLESRIAFTATTTGTYYLSAEGIGSGVGTFKLLVDDVGLVALDNVLASTATGGEVTAGGPPVAGTISPSGDQDWYKVTLTAGVQYRFDLHGYASGGGTLSDPYLRLLNSSGAAIATNDDANGTLDSSIVYTATTTGPYFLSAQAFGTSTGTFEISAVSLGSIPTDSIPGTSATLATLAAGGSVAGTIDAGSDQDWYRINLVSGHQYRFDLEGLSGGEGTLTDPLLRLVGTNGTTVLTTSDDANGSLDSSITYTATATGTFFLSAQGFGTSAGTYRLSAADFFGTQPDVPSGAGSTTSIGFTPRSGTIDFGGDEDWFKITLSAGHTYDFDLQGVDTPSSGTLVDPYLRLLNAHGLEVVTDDDSGTGLESHVSYTPAQTEVYFVSAQGFGSSTGTYTLDIDDRGAPADLVPGSTATSATVAVGRSVTGLVNTGNDEDWYKVTLKDGHTYRFELLGEYSNQGTLHDPLLRLLNSSGTQLAFNDDISVDRLESSFTYQVPVSGAATGTFYLSAQGFATGIGTYRLNVLDLSSPVDVPQDTATGSTLPINSFVNGLINSGGDYDWYRITLESGHMYEIDLRGHDSGAGSLLDPYLEIYNPAGQLELFDDNSGVGVRDSFLQITAFDAGTYYVSAEAYGVTSFDIGTYRLELNEIDVFGSTSSIATVGPGKSITGNVSFAGDQDWFVLSTIDGATHETLIAGETYRIELKGMSEPGNTLADPYLRLLNSSGAEINFNDDSNGTLNSSIEFTAAASTTYYVSAEGFGTNTGTYTLSLTPVGGDVFSGDSGVNALVGTPGNDVISGFAGNDILDGKEGNDVIDGGVGDDTLAGGIGDDLVFGDAGNDVFTAAGQESRGDDVLFGEAGNDEFSDFLGNNALDGGDGDDLFWLFAAEYGHSLITGGEGRDTYRLLPGLAPVPAGQLPISVVTDFVVGPGGDLLDVDRLLIASAADGSFVPGESSVGDFLRIAQSGTDARIQWDRDGTGAGYGWVTQVVLKNVDADKVASENFSGLIDIGTKSDDHLVGGLGNDNVVGVGGNDVLDGGGGEDILQGGSGNDTYYVDNAKDVVLETSNTPGSSSLVFLPGIPDPIKVESLGIEGIADTVIAAVNYSLQNAAFVENLKLAGAALQATGNSLANVLTGNSGKNVLSGEGGADKLDGASGNDILNGGAGNDALNGGAGNDVMDGGAGTDVVKGISGADVLTGGAGADKFDFDAVGDSGATAATRDRIVDFSHAQGDKIDLSTIDANGSGSGNTAFKFVTGGFTAAGQIRFDAANHVLLGSTDSDTAAEFSIHLPNLSSMVSGDFIL